ncbi:dihydropteroate synthase [Candidatus Peregrinibacteria bacterium]|jgi:dihydropteroate synthase|nr:dihydropteroate synthase [Candidatus Peregrinibacteria bacterium]MBT3598949.1 dihydropteroate synthase [Candidatus Peregrinibacteria bacterium]MBT4367498.1 dihydropteroate synthase [Candidatus Peregrinibacteria bacterium]MBT4585895.1 dihydropteroate synthase [Candidatus Peregrinibacteria bacterium]MBT6731109.1 dihydropteroate synthase [Candidatus Peregrinibacteria bacterium]
MEKEYKIVGILNTTPDSYFDGGKYLDVDSALVRIEEMIEEGVDIIDIGGESTGPGSKEVSANEESDRVIPIIKACKDKYPNLEISIDTYKSSVAQEAIDVGATIVNDVTAGRGDKNMFNTIAKNKVPIVLMYSKDNSPRTTIKENEYEDVINTIIEFLKSRIDVARTAGIPYDQIIIDPGMGHFVSSNPKYSFEIIARLKELKDALKLPILVSPSRKSFLSGKNNLPPSERLPETIAASCISVLNGAEFIRTHDVKEVGRGCAVASNTAA